MTFDMISLSVQLHSLNYQTYFELWFGSINIFFNEYLLYMRAFDTVRKPSCNITSSVNIISFNVIALTSVFRGQSMIRSEGSDDCLCFPTLPYNPPTFTFVYNRASIPKLLFMTRFFDWCWKHKEQVILALYCDCYFAFIWLRNFRKRNCFKCYT